MAKPFCLISEGGALGELTYYGSLKKSSFFIKKVRPNLTKILLDVFRNPHLGIFVDPTSSVYKLVVYVC